jgi:thioredoxin 1
MIRSIAAFAFLCLASLAMAAGNPFEQAPFEAARKAGKPVVVVVYADWCPTCRKQDPAVEALLKTPEFAGFELFRVDFDMQDDALKMLKVTRQSTLIVYKGQAEVSRTTGETRPDALASQLRKAL